MTFSVVIPSGSASNLVECITSILAYDEQVLPHKIIVVEDGSRAEAEDHIASVHWVTGQKPFIFARNVNLGILECTDDIFLLGDDAQLVSTDGLTGLSDEVNHHPEVGVCSAGILGTVNNPNQHAVCPPSLRYEDHSLAFVGVFIPRHVIDRVGLLDERFVGYGFDDDDYCRRVRESGLRLAIWDGCILDHRQDSKSVYRTQSNWTTRYIQNQAIFHDKWST